MRLALDLSCLIPQPLTGVGYYTLNLFEAYAQAYPSTRIRSVGFSAQPAPPFIRALRDTLGLRTYRVPSRVHQNLWLRSEWPPIDAFTGPADVAHGAFHLLPPSRRAKRVITLFDLSNLRRANINIDANVRTHKGFLEHAARRGDAIVAISESSQRDAIELIGADPERTFVVYGGIQPEEFTQELDVDAQKAVQQRFGIAGPYFIHLGTLEPRKNIPRLLEAYARLRERHKDAPRLVLAGGKGWMYDEIFQRVDALKLHQHVVHTGYLDRADAVLLLRGAYACVYPSLYEGFGLPVLEAMAARVPVLTSNVSSLPEVVGDTGVLVDPESVDSIEQGLEQLLLQPDWARGQVERAFDRAQQFTWQSSAATLHGVYESLLAR